MKKAIVVCLTMLLINSLLAERLWAERFRFQYLEHEKYRIITEVDEKIYVNGVFSHRSSILNKIAVETLEVKDGSGLLQSSFQTSERAYGVQTSFTLTEDYLSTFWRDESGLYTIDPQYYMPVVRNVPFFPKEDVQMGDSWSAAGEEVHDFRRSYGIPEAFRFPIQVQYTYLGNEKRAGRELAVIKIHYTVFHRVESRYPGLVPVKITGISEQTFYFDNNSGKPRYYEERFDFIVLLSDGQYVEYEGTAWGELIESPRLNKEEVADEIREELREKGIDNTVVRTDEKGVTLTLQNIQFSPNSAQLWESEKEKIRRIGEILNNYNDRDILIRGHTARVPGYSEEDFQSLSEKRAGSVADYLLSLGVLDPTQLAVRGLGASEPVAGNAGEAGRRLNRRVEITILEN